MEKKTIGKFISVLRRASGLTQKELGERLYVSDKTVSRWERDECTPELSLLPAIAEIFGITTDELLRGERLSGTAEATQGQRARSDKQFKSMLHSRMVRFRNLSIVSVAIALAALILAAVVNVSFWKGILAFGIGAVVILAALVCQLCVASSLLLRLDEEDDTYEAQMKAANSKILTGTAGVLIAIVSIFAFILPLGILGGSFYGLSAGSMVLWGLAFGAAALIVSYVLYLLIIRKLLERKGLICKTEKDENRRKLMLRTLRGCGIVMLVIAVGIVVVQILGPEIYARRVDTFTDVEAFQDFMEDGAVEAWKEETVREYGSVAVAAPTCVFIDVGNDGLYEDVLWPPEFEQAEITATDGTLLCTYAFYDPFVRDVRWNVDDATGQVEITAYTLQGMENARRVFSDIRSGLVLLMMVNVLAWAIGYVVCLIRRRKG